MPTDSSPVVMRHFVRLRMLAHALLLGSTVLLPPPAGAGEMRVVDVHGKSVQVFLPSPLPARLTADGLTAEDAVPVRILIADPDPPVEPTRIPRRSTLAGAITPNDPAATFSITYVPAGGTDNWGEPCFAFPAAAQAAFDAAAVIWAESVVSTVPITIRACWADLGSSSTLGYSGGGPLHRDFAGAPVAGTWYSASLANALAGSDLSASFDMHITYNANFAWYFGTDGATPAGQMDLVSVVLHEVGHGLNFAGTAQVSGGLGSWGLGSGFPSIYDRFVHDGSATALLNTAVYPNSSAALASLLTSQNLWFRGASAMVANGGAPVRLYAPAVWAPGSSYSHLDYATFVGTSNRLMVYALASGVSVHSPGAVTLALLHDLGWSLNAGTPTYTLNVASSGASGVVVAATPSAYAGTTNYSRTGIAGGTNISLTAPATSGGMGFTTWTGCDSTSATVCTVVMNASKTVTAGYASYLVSVAANPPAGGTVSCSPNPVSHGGSSTCTATANPGYAFAAFSGDCTGATCVLTNVTGPRSVTANFTLLSYAVTTIANPPAGGTVSCSPNPVSHGGSSTCTASANSGYAFAAFSGDCTGATCVLTNVTGPRSVTASFTLLSYAVTTIANPPAGGTVSCSPNPVSHGGSSTCTASANPGYAFAAFSSDCSGATCVLTNVTGPRSVTANFTTSQAAQTIAFSPLPDKVYGDLPSVLSATATSGLPVSFASGTPSVCSVTGTTLTLLAAGSCTVRASQAGSATYLPAPDVLRSFNVARATTATGLLAIPATVAAGASVTLAATVIGVTPTGTIAFKLHHPALPGCEAVALTGGGSVRTAQCVTPGLAPGAYTFTAVYEGDGDHTGSSGSTGVVVTAVSGSACASFTDVDAASPFCPNVEWLRNRSVTLGCTATAYCPGDSVTRLQMAAFMMRLGTALTPVPIDVEASGAALDPDAQTIVCASAPLAVTGFPRLVRLDARVNLRSAGTAAASVELVASGDGATWTAVAPSMAVGLRAGHWTSARVQGHYDAQVGESLRFGLRVARVSGTADVDAHGCRLRALAASTDLGHSPFDPLH